jgi:hypothetical protein
MADGVDPRTGSAEGETPERPAPAEVGKPGTPGADAHRSAAAPGAAAAPSAAPGAAAPAEVHLNHARHAGGTKIVGELHDTGHGAGATEHGGGSGHGDGELDDHGEARLGPIDWPAWAASALGVAVGVVIAALFYLAVMPL